MSNQFLKDLWREKTRKEKSEKRWKYDIWDIKKQIEKIKDKEARKNVFRFFERLKKSCLDLANAFHEREEMADKVNKNTQQGIRDEGDLRALENADFRERAAHRVLQDNLNILARLLRKRGIEPYWRDYLSDWEQIRVWALDMAEEIKKN